MVSDHIELWKNVRILFRGEQPAASKLRKNVLLRFGLGRS